MFSLVLLISSLLLIATVLVEYLIYKKASFERLKNRKRLFAWWIIFSVCSICFYLGLKGVSTLVIALSIWASIEFFQILQCQNKFRFVLITTIVLVILLLSIFAQPNFGQVYFSVCLFLALISYLYPIHSIVFVTSFYVYYISSLSSIILITILLDDAGNDFSYCLLILFFITAVNDIAQYIAGNLFGKRKISPNLSPNKTFEGLLGGLFITGTLCGLLLPEVLPMLWWDAFVIGCCLSLAGFYGDLILSKLKRGMNIKDSGNTIMGHGGLFDRIDSLLLVFPVFGLLVSMGDFV